MKSKNSSRNFVAVFYLVEFCNLIDSTKILYSPLEFYSEFRPGDRRNLHDSLESSHAVLLYYKDYSLSLYSLIINAALRRVVLFTINI